MKRTSIGFIDSLYYSPTRAYRACWPYVCYSGYGGNLWLYNAFVSDYICRIEPPTIEHGKVETLKIINTFITND